MFLNHLTATHNRVLFSIMGTIALSVLIRHVLSLKLIFTLKTTHILPNKGLYLNGKIALSDDCFQKNPFLALFWVIKAFFGFIAGVFSFRKLGNGGGCGMCWKELGRGFGDQCRV